MLVNIYVYHILVSVNMSIYFLKLKFSVISFISLLSCPLSFLFFLTYAIPNIPNYPFVLFILPPWIYCMYCMYNMYITSTLRPLIITDPLWLPLFSPVANEATFRRLLLPLTGRVWYWQWLVYTMLFVRLLKGTVARDFLVSIFFVDPLYMGPRFRC